MKSEKQWNHLFIENLPVILPNYHQIISNFHFALSDAVIHGKPMGPMEDKQNIR